MYITLKLFQNLFPFGVFVKFSENKTLYKHPTLKRVWLPSINLINIIHKVLGIKIINHFKCNADIDFNIIIIFNCIQKFNRRIDPLIK